MTPNRPDELIQSLDLAPHPEGGHFREVFRSPSIVETSDDRRPRSAVTTIYYLLRAGQRSRWHRVGSDEIWHFYEGDPLELLWIEPDEALQRVRLGPVSGESAPVAVVPAGCWQAAHPLGEYALVGCSVGPGFDFADFRMLRDEEPEAERICERYPGLADFL